MSDYKSSEMLTSEMYSLVETIENESKCVTASPDIWINGEDILLWPPGPANRRDPIPPQSNWIPHKCKILKRNIATFEEALREEKKFSKHNDSNSFRAAEAKKKLKRAHPVNENSNIKSGLIDLNSMVKKIKGTDGQAKIPRKMGDVNNRLQQQTKYHEQCHKNNKENMRPGTLSSIKTQNVKSNTGTIKKPIPPLKKFVKSEHLNGKQEVKNIDKPMPRYTNYLKSGTKNPQITVPQKKSKVSATVTKKQYLNQQGFSENDFQNSFGPADSQFVSKSIQPQKASNYLTASQNLGQRQIDSSAEHNNSNYSPQFEQAGSNEDMDDFRCEPRTVNVVENILLNPAMNSTPMLTDFSFQSTVLKCLDNIKQICLQGDIKRVHFEARMQTQWDVFVSKMSQGNFGHQNEPQNEQDYDFEEFDEQFPKNRKGDVEEVEISIREDFDFKRRLFNRMDQLGGTEPKEAIRMKMKYLFTDKCLDHYTWRGVARKAAFEKFTFLNALMYKSVRTNFKNFSKKSFDSYMVQWLKHSGTRQRTVVYTYPDRASPEEMYDEPDRVDQNEDEDENVYCYRSAD